VTELELILPDWPVAAGVRAAFICRTGGASAPPFDSLNIGARVGDDPEAVARNRARVGEVLALPSEPAWLEQVHGSSVIELTRLSPPRVPRADAAVARDGGPVCVIQVADCMPVLFAARDGSAVGAAHAGWRGLAAGVLEATVHALEIEPPQLLAWMGPAIGPRHFEVGEEVRAAFTQHDAATVGAFVPNARGRWQCDLYALARQRLQSLGVRSIHGGDWCTYADPERFFSYRRDGRCGRMAALIWLSQDAGPLKAFPRPPQPGIAPL
jgi:YfiH family protein